MTTNKNSIDQGKLLMGYNSTVLIMRDHFDSLRELVYAQDNSPRAHPTNPLNKIKDNSPIPHTINISRVMGHYNRVIHYASQAEKYLEELEGSSERALKKIAKFKEDATDMGKSLLARVNTDDPDYHEAMDILNQGEMR